MASRGGSAKGNREVAALKEEIKSVIADVRAGELDRNDAAVMIQGYRALKDFIALERQVKETDELAAEIEELKREYGVSLGARSDASGSARPSRASRHSRRPRRVRPLFRNRP